MRMIINVLAAVLLALPAAASAQGPDLPACRATLDGQSLLTTIEFNDGYTIEGPWRVVDNRAASLRDGRAGVVLAASLDRIVETDPEGRKKQTPFPDPIQTTFEGRDEDDLMKQAAQVWCLTVLKVQGELPAPAPAPARTERITRIAR